MINTGLIIVLFISWMVLFFLYCISYNVQADLFSAQAYFFLYYYEDWCDYIAIKHRPKPERVSHHRWYERLASKEYYANLTYFVEDYEMSEEGCFWIGGKKTAFNSENLIAIKLYEDLKKRLV